MMKTKFDGIEIVTIVVFLLFSNLYIKLNIKNNTTNICNNLETLSGTPRKLSREVNTKNISGSNNIDQIYNFDMGATMFTC